MTIGRNADERFNAILVDVDGHRKIHTVKLVIEITGISIAGARDLIEHLPHTVKRNVSLEEGEALVRRFYALGAHWSWSRQPSPCPADPRTWSDPFGLAERAGDDVVVEAEGLVTAKGRYSTVGPPVGECIAFGRYSLPTRENWKVT